MQRKHILVNLAAIVPAGAPLLMRNFLIFALFALCLPGCAGQQPGSAAKAETPGQDQEPVLASDQSQATYHLMMGELALERGYRDEAVREMLLAAEYGNDPEIAARATELAVAAGDAESAERAARRWHQLDPENFSAQRYLMRLLLDQGRVQEALPYLEHIRAGFIESDSPQPDLNVLSILLEGQDMLSAARAMEAVAGGTPMLADTAYALSTLHMAAGQLDRALDFARLAREGDPQWTAATMLMARIMLARGDIDAGLEVAAAAMSHSEDPGERLAYGALLAGAGRYDEARQALMPLLEEYPALPAVLRTLGFVEFQARQWDEAQQYFSRLLSTGQDYEEANFYLASIALEQGHSEEALIRFREVNPGDYFVLAQLGIRDAFLQQGFTDSAILHLQDVGRWRPEYSVPMITAEAELLADLSRFDDALAVYDRGLEKHPGELDLRLGRAFVMDQSGDLKGSIKALRKIVRELPDNAMALNALGYTLADRTSSYREAYKLISKAHELEPSSPAILDSMGWVEFRRGNLEKALKYLERAQRLARDPEIAAHMGEVLWSMGRQEQARQVWDEALERDPDDRVLRETVERLAP